MNESLRLCHAQHWAGASGGTGALYANTLTNFDGFWYCIIMNGQTQTNCASLPVRHKNKPGEAPAAPGLTKMRVAALAARLKELADPTRLRMLDLLAHQMEPLCVCDITSQFDQNQPTISHHLKLLRRAGLIACEKRGIWAFYWVTDEGRRCLQAVAALT